MRMHIFISYKGGGADYEAWDPKGQVVVGSRDLMFSVDSLLLPALHEATAFANDDNEPLVQQHPNPVRSLPPPAEVIGLATRGLEPALTSQS